MSDKLCVWIPNAINKLWHTTSCALTIHGLPNNGKCLCGAEITIAEQYHPSIPDLIDRIDAFDQKTLDAQYTDSGELWELVRLIRTALNDPRTPKEWTRDEMADAPDGHYTDYDHVYPKEYCLDAKENILFFGPLPMTA